MKTTIFLTSILSTLGLVSAHARIKNPQPLGYNSRFSGNAYNRPLAYDGSDFPCKGLINASGVNMNPVAEWQPGAAATFEIQPNDDPNGGEGNLAAHSGGSCQISLSFDGGKTFKVLHSYIGGCPRDVKQNSNIAGPNQVFEFEVPAGTKGGNAIASWSWIANTGNRGEFYQNCASIKIKGDGTNTLTDRPDMWVGDLIKGAIKKDMCLSTGGANLAYPDPGAKVTTVGKGTPPKGPGPDGTFAVCSAPGSTGKTPAPTPDKPKGDKPKDDAPKGDKPKDDAPKGDNPNIPSPNSFQLNLGPTVYTCTKSA